MYQRYLLDLLRGVLVRKILNDDIFRDVLQDKSNRNNLRCSITIFFSLSALWIVIYIIMSRVLWACINKGWKKQGLRTGEGVRGYMYPQHFRQKLHFFKVKKWIWICRRSRAKLCSKSLRSTLLHTILFHNSPAHCGKVVIVLSNLLKKADFAGRFTHFGNIFLQTLF